MVCQLEKVQFMHTLVSTFTSKQYLVSGGDENVLPFWSLEILSKKKLSKRSDFPFLCGNKR
jgi:hypothetical protein